jgi:hypothetical protein
MSKKSFFTDGPMVLGEFGPVDPSIIMSCGGSFEYDASPDGESALLGELQRRRGQLERGEVVPRAGDEVREELRALLRRG